MSRPMNVLFDIEELVQLVSRDIVGILYRLYNTHKTPTDISVEALVEYWIQDTLYRSDHVLLAYKPDTLILTNSALHNALRCELHPAYTTLLYRLLPLTHDQTLQEVNAVRYRAGTLILEFASQPRIDHARHPTHRIVS